MSDPIKDAVERLRSVADERAMIHCMDWRELRALMLQAADLLSTSNARVKALEEEKAGATSLARRAILGMARVRGMLEEGVRNAAILRTESVYVPAPMAREFIALGKALQEEDLGDARSTLTEAPGHG